MHINSLIKRLTSKLDYVEIIRHHPSEEISVLIYSLSTHPSALVSEPLVELCLDEELEQPAAHHGQEGDNARAGHVLANVGPHQVVAVRQQSCNPSNIDPRCRYNE